MSAIILRSSAAAVSSPMQILSNPSLCRVRLPIAALRGANDVGQIVEIERLASLLQLRYKPFDPVRNQIAQISVLFFIEGQGSPKCFECNCKPKLVQFNHFVD